MMRDEMDNEEAPDRCGKFFYEAGSKVISCGSEG
jgi:hypothetical protein